MKIKGIKDGILVTLGDLDWQDLQTELFGKIEEKQAFFHGARMVLDVDNKTLSVKEIEEVRNDLLTQDIELIGILSKSLVTKNAAKNLGMIIELDFPKQKNEETIKPLDTSITGEAALFLHRTMRSGFKIAYQGHVIIFGDVNPGAEIIASGSIVVWGRLRGTAHAGAEGDQNAVVCALDLSPTQLRIASIIAVTPQDQETPEPEVARVYQDQIIAEPWQQKQGDK